MPGIRNHDTTYFWENVKLSSLSERLERLAKPACDWLDVPCLNLIQGVAWPYCQAVTGLVAHWSSFNPRAVRNRMALMSFKLENQNRRNGDYIYIYLLNPYPLNLWDLLYIQHVHLKRRISLFLSIPSHSILWALPMWALFSVEKLSFLCQDPSHTIWAIILT